jgi:hypothetical protein
MKIRAEINLRQFYFFIRVSLALAFQPKKKTKVVLFAKGPLGFSKFLQHAKSASKNN